MQAAQTLLTSTDYEGCVMHFIDIFVWSDVCFIKHLFKALYTIILSIYNFFSLICYSELYHCTVNVNVG